MVNRSNNENHTIFDHMSIVRCNKHIHEDLQLNHVQKWITLELIIKTKEESTNAIDFESKRSTLR